MTLFVDTSALIALLDADDAEHDPARDFLSSLQGPATRLVTHDYVLVETTALVQRRLGMGLVHRLYERLVPALTVMSVTAATRDRAVAALLAADRRSVSLVDWVSFETMRREELDAAFAFDDDFTRQGFSTRP